MTMVAPLKSGSREREFSAPYITPARRDVLVAYTEGVDLLIKIAGTAPRSDGLYRIASYATTLLDNLRLEQPRQLAEGGIIRVGMTIYPDSAKHRKVLRVNLPVSPAVTGYRAWQRQLQDSSRAITDPRISTAIEPALQICEERLALLAKNQVQVRPAPESLLMWFIGGYNQNTIDTRMAALIGAVHLGASPVLSLPRAA